MQSHLIRAVALAGGAAVVLAACGLKEGVVVLAEEGGGGGGSVGGPADPGSGGVAGPGTSNGGSGDGVVDPGAGDGVVDPGAGGSGDGVVDPGAGGGGDGGTGGGDGGSGQVWTLSGSDRTGVTDDTIHVAIHAPVTGAAPLPSKSFELAGETYWLWKTQKLGETVLGRTKVEVEFADDKYDPNTARGICRDLASRNFMVVGGGGTDQIQACGALAGVSGFPYFSPGVTEAGLETASNPWYFAGSMTYRQQGKLLAAFVKTEFGNAKVAAVITQTPNFEDAKQGWEEGVVEQGLNYYKTARHTKGDTSWWTAVRDDFIANGVEVVYVLSSPVDYIGFAQKYAEETADTPQYVGVGISMGLNAVLGSGCPQVDGGLFFSPFPALDKIDELDPDFNKAAAEFGKPNDDIALALWSLAKIQDRVFEAYEAAYNSTDLTREDLRALMETLTVQTNVFPDINWTQANHFGGSGVHVLRANCDEGVEQYQTYKSYNFRSTF
ncbi:MAG: ABC transporter substrate-binding protein [Nitriliruptorales bacterium]|nr:ABC transporter substrate-binding protein [Nitriliruptorales bacterium]